MTSSPSGAGQLSQLLEELARIPRAPIPDRHFEGLTPGTHVGRFVVRREIGRGGFGVVYAAQDAELGREVALKVLRPGIVLARGETEWIRAEAEAVARLNHPAIVTIFEAGRSERGAYLIFELLRGEGLDVVLARGGMTLDEVIRIAIAVASALEQAHGAGVLHRDLKPANVFICEGGTVKVLDFGIAQLFDREPTPGAGTPGYMAPEQLEGRAQDARSDLFTLGVLVRDMLAACTAGDGARRSTRRAIALRRLCEDLTQPDPGRRPASAQDVRNRLEAIRRDRDSIIRRIALPVLAAITVAVAVWGVVEALQPKEAPPGERVVVALSSAQNESGLAELDHLADLVRIALTDSRRIAVVAQPRMEAEIRGLGTTPAAASSEEWRTAAARLGAAMVVDLKARRDGAELGIEFTSRDTGTGRVRFQATATTSSLEALPRELDGVIRSFRRESGERRSDLRRDSGSLGELATSSLVAFRQYVLGVMCMEAAPEMGIGKVLAAVGSIFVGRWRLIRPSRWLIGISAWRCRLQIPGVRRPGASSTRRCRCLADCPGVTRPSPVRGEIASLATMRPRWADMLRSWRRTRGTCWPGSRRGTSSSTCPDTTRRSRTWSSWSAWMRRIRGRFRTSWRAMPSPDAGPISRSSWMGSKRLERRRFVTS